MWRPDGSSLSLVLEGERAPSVVFDWWTGPGVYRVDARRYGWPTRTAVFRTYGGDLDVRLDVCRDAIETHVAVRDPGLRARFIRETFEIEIENDTDIEWRAHAQSGALHFFIDPVRVDPAWSPEELRARSLWTQGWCGTGVHLLDFPSRTTSRVPLAPPRGLTRAGDYVATITLRAADGHETFVSFDFSLRPSESPAFPGELSLVPASSR